MRVRRLMIVGAAVWTSAAGVAASANPYGGGTRLTGPPPAEIPTGPISQQDKARIVALRFAACLVKARRSAVLNAIKREPWEPDAGRMLVNVVDERCLERGELAMPSNLLRGALSGTLSREIPFGSAGIAKGPDQFHERRSRLPDGRCQDRYRSATVRRLCRAP